MEGTLYKSPNGDHYYLTVNGKIIADIDAHPLSSINVSKLSKQNCQEIENGYDLEDLTDEYAEEWKFDERIGFRDGVKKGIELKGNKKYTDDDIVDAYMAGHIRGMSVNMGEDNIHPICSEYLNSLQKTEWDVWVVMSCGLPDGCTEPEKECSCDIIPALDEDGCLILTKNII